ncbi:carboxypeptidase B [Condylostylus longicornis]|uniref:carboxypeptidase B n=1 Tax=Condylostylus longicornis TaxID=2530218 RepID=UPI00244DA741|nr:carboxypeptidase B [Condylostylus longicornis]
MILFEFKLISLLFLIIASTNGFEEYKGYKIYEIIPSSVTQSNILYKISLKNEEIDMLTLTKLPNVPARALVPPKHQQKFENDLISNGITFRLINSNVSNSIFYNNFHNFFKRATRQHILEDYYRYNEINSFLKDLAERFPERVSVKKVGDSYEGRAINAITITNGKNSLTSKNVIFIDAGIHAREWIAPSTALYIIYQLVEKFDENKHLLENYDWIVIPLVNVDGYEYTHKSQRFWRKTRKPSSAICYGTDGNRNFDFHWGEQGASSLPCQETFKGEKAFSEPETQIVRDILLSLTGRGKMYLTLHSYGNLLLYPWGYTSALPENWKDLDEVCKAGSNAIKLSTGTNYRVGSSTNVLYAAAGGSDDYALGVAKIPIAVTMELPSGGSGFDPKPSQIRKMVTEAWIGIKAMAEKVIEKY